MEARQLLDPGDDRHRIGHRVDGAAAPKPDELIGLQVGQPGRGVEAGLQVQHPRRHLRIDAVGGVAEPDIAQAQVLQQQHAAAAFRLQSLEE